MNHGSSKTAAKRSCDTWQNVPWPCLKQLLWLEKIGWGISRQHNTEVHNVNKHFLTEWSFITKGRLVNIRNPEATQIRLRSRSTLFPPTTTWHPCLCATQWRNQNKLQPDLSAEHQRHQRRPSSQRFSCCGKLSLSVRPSMLSTFWFSIDFN